MDEFQFLDRMLLWYFLMKGINSSLYCWSKGYRSVQSSHQIHKCIRGHSKESTESEQFARKASAETGHFAWDGKLRIKGSTGHVNCTQRQTQAWLKFSKPWCLSPWAKSSRHSCIYRLIQRRTVRPNSNSATQRTERSLRPLCTPSLHLRCHIFLSSTPSNSFDLTVTVWDPFSYRSMH